LSRAANPLRWAEEKAKVARQLIISFFFSALILRALTYHPDLEMLRADRQLNPQITFNS
jgi:hypothetical protein